MPAASYRYAARRFCRRATPATLTGVNGRPTRAWALSTDSETPRCSDQLKESRTAHAKVGPAIASFLRRIWFMDLLHSSLPPCWNGAPRQGPGIAIDQRVNEQLGERGQRQSF